MLDPGRYFAEAIYFLQYTLAQILWAISRAAAAIAVIAESISTWLTDNIGYFIQLLVNALSAPLGGMFILALTALGFWYVFNNIISTNRWVDPGKLVTYGFIAFFFFSSPIIVIDMMEDLRGALNAGIDQALLDGAAGDIFTTGMNGTDTGLPGAIPDVNGDGVIGSFDLAAAFMMVANLDELDSSEFPLNFETTFFPFGDPSNIDLSDEADQELAKALASDGIERLFFSLVAIPTVIAEHFLRLSLTGVAVFLYAGVPFALVFAFFIYTQAFLGAYIRQFINLLIETFMSVVITAMMIGLLAAAARQGVGLYIGAGLITLLVLAWRIKSALKLASAAFDLFGGATITGGAGGMEMARMGQQAVAGSAALAGATLTGGATLAVGGAVLASAAALQADGRASGAYLGTDPGKTEGRVQQLKTVAGYTLGNSQSARRLIEGSHELRTLARNFRDGAALTHDPDMLDYLRAGSSMSGFGSSPWLAMRTSPSLRTAFDQIGGSRGSYRDAAFDGDGEPVDWPGSRAGGTLTDSRAPAAASSSVNGPLPTWLQAGDADAEAISYSGGEPSGGGVDPNLDSSPPSPINLTAPDASRQQQLHTMLAQLNDLDAAAGQAARRQLAVFAGSGHARTIEDAVAQHTAAAVQTAVTAVVDVADQYRQQGMDDAAMLAVFQRGEAATAIRAATDTPLADESLAAIADVTLQPRRRLTRADLVAAIGQAAATGAVDEQAVRQAVGTPASFGGQTGHIRGVLEGAVAMQLAPETLARLARMIQDGMRPAAQDELTGRGYRPSLVRDFLSDMAALPGGMVVPQSAWVGPSDSPSPQSK